MATWGEDWQWTGNCKGLRAEERPVARIFSRWLPLRVFSCWPYLFLDQCPISHLCLISGLFLSSPITLACALLYILACSLEIAYLFSEHQASRMALGFYGAGGGKLGLGRAGPLRSRSGSLTPHACAQALLVSILALGSGSEAAHCWSLLWLILCRFYKGLAIMWFLWSVVLGSMKTVAALIF